MTTRIQSSEGGFTLIEMVISLAVFLLLAGAVFGIFGATLQSVASLQDNQNRNDQTEALGAWLKQEMLEVPANGTITSFHRDGLPFHVAGIVWGADQDLQALDLHMQPNGNYTLRLTVYQPPPESSRQIGGVTGTASLSQFMAQIMRDDDSLAWRPLVHDLKSADWRFLPFNQTQWQDTASGDKPAIAEFTFLPGGALAPITDDFWVPPTQPANIAAAAPAPVVSANP